MVGWCVVVRGSGVCWWWFVEVACGRLVVSGWLVVCGWLMVCCGFVVCGGWCCVVGWRVGWMVG